MSNRRRIVHHEGEVNTRCTGRISAILADGLYAYLKNRGLLRGDGKGQVADEERAPVPVNRPEPPIRRPSRPLFDLTSNPGRALFMRRRNAL